MLSEKKGLFIVFEGIDGCGKSTQAELFIDYLYNLNKYQHVLRTREPYQQKDIRDILKQEKDPYIKAEKLLELFVEDRREHVKKVIVPNLKAGVDVVCDRYWYSTAAYQSAQGIPIEKIVKMHTRRKNFSVRNYEFPVPDLTYFIDSSPEIASERINTRASSEKFDNKEFQEKIRQNYLLLLKMLPNHIIIKITDDGKKEIKDIADEIKGRFDAYYSHLFAK